MARDVAAYLTEQQRKSNASGNGEVAQAWAEMEELYNKKYVLQIEMSILAKYFCCECSCI